MSGTVELVPRVVSKPGRRRRRARGFAKSSSWPSLGPEAPGTPGFYFTERALQSVKAGSHRLDFVWETPWVAADVLGEQARPRLGEPGVGGGGLLRRVRSLGFLHLKHGPPLLLLRKRGLLLPGVCCELNPSWSPVLFASNRPQTAWVGVSVSRGRRVVGTALAPQPLPVNRFQVRLGFPPQGSVGLSASLFRE